MNHASPLQPPRTQHLQPLHEDLWHATHAFRVMGLPVRSRMTVARLPDGTLWLHSPIPPTPTLKAELDALGPVAHLLAPSKTHHLFLPQAMHAWPQARLYGAPGLAAKRPDLPSMAAIPADAPAPWSAVLSHRPVDGIPVGNETAWFHAPSSTLILTDLVQWWADDAPWAARAWARLVGVRHAPAVPSTVRALVRDPAALRASVAALLQWPFSRVVMAHERVVDGAQAQQVRRVLEQLAGG